MPPPVTWRGIRRRTWIVLIVLESVASVLLVSGLYKQDVAAIIAALGIGLIYAPIRAGGWTLVKSLLARRQDPARAEDAFYGRRKK
ncbi:MAG: hypothetical protein ABI939_11255 [Anaerolineaceae bacterium]